MHPRADQINPQSRGASEWFRLIEEKVESAAFSADGFGFHSPVYLILVNKSLCSRQVDTLVRKSGGHDKTSKV